MRRCRRGDVPVSVWVRVGPRTRAETSACRAPRGILAHTRRTIAPYAAAGFPQSAMIAERRGLGGPSPRMRRRVALAATASPARARRRRGTARISRQDQVDDRGRKKHLVGRERLRHDSLGHTGDLRHRDRARERSGLQHAHHLVAVGRQGEAQSLGPDYRAERGEGPQPERSRGVDMARGNAGNRSAQDLGGVGARVSENASTQHQKGSRSSTHAGVSRSQANWASP